MPISFFPQFLFISVLSTFISTTNFTHAYSQCLNDQKALLLHLKNDLIFNSSISKKLVQWNQTEDCCSWKGVECGDTGHVISLQLDDESISGGLENSSSLFSLRNLKKLNLAYNNFNYTQIPSEIHNLTYLTHLNLSHAAFGGQVPLELSLLRKLVSLDISDSYWHIWHLQSKNWGIQPLKLEYPDLGMLLQNLTGLKELYLDSVDISAQKSEWYHIISSSLPGLRDLSLCYCSLSGPLDWALLQLHSLSILRLDGNNFSAAFPDLFANFSSLTTLSLSNCSLKGPLPKSIFQIPTLQNLDLSDNQLVNSTITQFPQSGSLRSLVLSYTNFSGPLPDSISNFRMLSNIEFSGCNLTGPIPSTLSNITKLVSLDLSFNSLTGSLSSMHFEGLSNLAYLSLWYNSLNGGIPQSLFDLPSLQTLWLDHNQFSGTFQLKKIQRLRNLTGLDLSYNSLSVDASSTNSSLSAFPQLRYLSLASCNLIGPIPSTLSNITKLVFLDLSFNLLSGSIPQFLFDLPSLQALRLGHNQLNGTFQLKKIQRLRNLTSLDLSYNNLSVDASSTNSSLSAFPQLRYLGLASCNLHSFPDLRNQSNLNSLDLSNNKIAGEIPSWIWEIGNGTLWYLNLSTNLLVNLQKPYHIPTSLEVLDLHSNQLRGELLLPPNFGNLFFFSLAKNELSGSIPHTLCDSGDLVVLDLSVNNLSGNIPPCLLEDIENLEVLKLGRNNIGGHIPDKFSVNCSLETLDLSNNNLGGKIPKSLRNCKSLVFMNVGNNKIDDSFPCMLPQRLHVLMLRSNRFHGEVRCHNSLPNLQIIDIASNNFSGHLRPISFSSWRGMMLESDPQLRPNHSGSNFLSPNSYYQDEVTLTIKGLELKLVKIWPYFTSIDFSCNNFQGEIPDAIGNLSSLYLLNLSHNALTGTIPKSLGKLMQLGSLDLSVNQLKGAIPVELAGLTFLQVLNLSYNELVGKIPIGPQIQTFPVDFFEGNTGLCGLPLNISCSNTDEFHLQSHGKMEIEWDYVFTALGYGVGLGSVVWVLSCCQSFREKYFEKVDEVLQKILGRQDRKRRQGRSRVVRNQFRRQ